LGQEIELRRASKGLGNPLEASYWHLPKTPLHMTLQKVTGLVIGLIGTVQETTIRKYFQFYGKSRGMLARGWFHGKAPVMYRLFNMIEMIKSFFFFDPEQLRNLPQVKRISFQGFGNLLPQS